MAGRHQSFVLEVAQRLSHCSPADTEVCGKVRLAQVVARAVLAGRNRSPECVQGALAECAAVKVVQGLHGQRNLLHLRRA